MYSLCARSFAMPAVEVGAWRASPSPSTHLASTVELHLKTGRTPFDVNSVYLKTGQRFRVALKNRTGFYLKTGQCRHAPEALHLLHCRNEGVLGGLREPSAPPFLGTYGREFPCGFFS